MCSQRRILVALVWAACAAGVIALAAGCTLQPVIADEPVALGGRSATPSPTQPSYPGAQHTAPPPRPVTLAATGEYPPPGLTVRPTFFLPTWTPTATPITPLPTLIVEPLPTRTPLPLQEPPSGAPRDSLATLLYAARVEDTAEVRALRLDGEGQVWDDVPLGARLTSGWFGPLLPSPDGRWVATSSHYGRHVWDEPLHLVDLLGGTVRPLQQDGGQVFGRLVGWEVGGDLLLVVSRDPVAGRSLSETYRYDVLAETFHPLDLTPPDAAPGQPRDLGLDPQGRRLIYSWNWQRQDGEYWIDYTDIWTLDLTTGTWLPVGSIEGASVYGFAWSPTDDRVAALVDRSWGFPPFLAILDPRAGTVRAMGSAKSLGPLMWAPDGRRLAFLRADNSGPFLNEWGPFGDNVYDLEPAAGSIHRRTELEWMEISGLAWLPDGERLVLSVVDTSDEAAHTEIWLLDPASGEMRALARSVQPFSPLAWLPAGG